MKQEASCNLGGLLSPRKSRDSSAKACLGGFQWAGRFRVPLPLGSFPESPLPMSSPSSLCVIMSVQEGGREKILFTKVEIQTRETAKSRKLESKDDSGDSCGPGQSRRQGRAAGRKGEPRGEGEVAFS